MTPLIDGTVYHFEWRGLYDGVSILMDRETGSIWNHITGIAMDGPLAGAAMPVANLLHLSVDQTLSLYPDIAVALSDRPIRGNPGRWSPWVTRLPVLGERFRTTMAPEDTRLPTMEVGIGIWTDRVSRFYTMDRIMDAGRVVLDHLDGRRVAVFFEPGARALSAFYVDATSGEWDGDVLRFDSGQFVERGVLYEASGSRANIERPLQLFTRWYGYALTFPETEIWEGE